MKKYLLLLLLIPVTHISFGQDKVEIKSNINKILMKANGYQNSFFGGAISLQIFDEPYSTIASKVLIPNETKDIFYRLYFWKDPKWNTTPEIIISKNPKDAPEISSVIIRFKTFGDVIMEKSSSLRTPTNEMFLFCLDADAAELKKQVDAFVKKSNKE